MQTRSSWQRSLTANKIRSRNLVTWTSSREKVKKRIVVVCHGVTIFSTLGRSTLLPRFPVRKPGRWSSLEEVCTRPSRPWQWHARARPVAEGSLRNFCFPSASFVGSFNPRGSSLCTCTRAKDYREWIIFSGQGIPRGSDEGGLSKRSRVKIDLAIKVHCTGFWLVVQEMDFVLY